MKTNQNTAYFCGYTSQSTLSFLRIWKRMQAYKNCFCFAVFQNFKAENEKLQIVYANIRV